MHEYSSLIPTSGKHGADIWSKSDLLAEPDLSAVHRWAAGQGSVLRLSKGEAGRISLQFQPYVANDAARSGCGVWLGGSDSPHMAVVFEIDIVW